MNKLYKLVLAIFLLVTGGSVIATGKTAPIWRCEKKKQNKMAQKAAFVALLMSLGLGMEAKEVKGKVLFKEIDSGRMHVLLDTNGDDVEDTIMWYWDPLAEGAHPLIRAIDRRVKEGSIILFDDKAQENTMGFSWIKFSDIISI